jgi:hypothetical protein
LYGQDGSILLKPDWEIDLDGWFVPPRGFTKFKREEYLKLRSEGRIVADGVNAKVATLHRSTFLYTQLHYVDFFFYAIRFLCMCSCSLGMGRSRVASEAKVSFHPPSQDRLKD